MRMWRNDETTESCITTNMQISLQTLLWSFAVCNRIDVNENLLQFTTRNRMYHDFGWRPISGVSIMALMSSSRYKSLKNCSGVHYTEPSTTNQTSRVVHSHSANLRYIHLKVLKYLTP